MDASDTIDYGAAKKAGEGGGNFPVYRQSTYRAKIESIEYKPDNEYKGKAKPLYCFKIVPFEDVTKPGKPMIGTDGNPIENFFVTDEDKKVSKVLYFNVTLPLMISERSNFGKLVNAVFPKGQPLYKNLEEYVGANVLVTISANKKKTEDGTEVFRNKIEALQNAPLRYAKLEEAEKKINIIREALGKLKNKSLQKETDVKNLEREIGEIREKVKNIPDLKEIIFREEKQLKFSRGESNQLLEEKGGYQSKFDHCQKLKKEKKGIEGDLKKRKKEQGIYEKLIVAFGKNGIQALIIENVLPEIEEEANDILAKLTNNRTQISIESLRDLKSGESRETLDIKISDELGNRDYELYSGGESFRIDFALRIALSKLLTRRAGAKLRTLVMDEGFGTQDEEGIENLKQAIEAISNDFDKILIITHLESLKTAFPTNIEVTKLPEIGSRYKVINN